MLTYKLSSGNIQLRSGNGVDKLEGREFYEHNHSFQKVDIQLIVAKLDGLYHVYIAGYVGECRDTQNVKHSTEKPAS